MLSMLSTRSEARGRARRSRQAEQRMLGPGLPPPTVSAAPAGGATASSLGDSRGVGQPHTRPQTGSFRPFARRAGEGGGVPARAPLARWRSRRSSAPAPPHGSLHRLPHPSTSQKHPPNQFIPAPAYPHHTGTGPDQVQIRIGTGKKKNTIQIVFFPCQATIPPVRQVNKLASSGHISLEGQNAYVSVPSTLDLYGHTYGSAISVLLTTYHPA